MIIYANNNTVCRTALACSLVKLEKLATLLADLQTSQLWKLYSFAFWTGLNMVLWWIIKYFSPRKVLYVERLIIHQDYSPTPEGYFNDIALIKLSNKLDLGGMICSLNNESTACLGDSGGPLTVEIKGKHYLSGIVCVVERELCPIQVNEGPIQLR